MTPDILSRLNAAAEDSRIRIGGVNLPLLGMRTIQRFMDVRVMGLAAEMTYYAILSIFPIIGALGAGLGFIDRLAGSAQAAAAERTILSGIDMIFATEVTEEILVPLVQGLMREERAGFALGSFLITIFLASRIFRSAIDTLGVAYRTKERRGFFALWGLGFLFSMGALLTGTILLAMLVLDPLLGGAHVIAGWLGVDPLFAAVWSTLQWPVVLLVCGAFLATLYRFGPNVSNRWLDTVPGAVFGVVGAVFVTLGFRIYLATVGEQTLAVANGEDLVAVIAQVIGAGLACLLWVWLTSMVLLTGGVLNAEVAGLKRESDPSG